MKKHIIILAVLTGSCITGCGTADVTGSDPSRKAAVSELMNVYAETQTTAIIDESEKSTDVSEKKSTYSVAELVGEWAVPDTFGMNNTTMTIQSDGTFYILLHQ